MRQFDYKPLYFDPEKERREKRKRELFAADYQEDETYNSGHASRIKGAMRTKHAQFADQIRKDNKTSNLRLIFIAIALSFVAYYLYHSSGAWFDALLNH